MIEIPKLIGTNVANTNGCVTSPLDLVLKLLQVQCTNLDFYFLISDYEVEFSVLEYCDRVVIYFVDLCTVQKWAGFSSVFHQDLNELLCVMCLNFEISCLTTKS